MPLDFLSRSNMLNAFFFLSFKYNWQVKVNLLELTLWLKNISVPLLSALDWLGPPLLLLLSSSNNQQIITGTLATKYYLFYPWASSWEIVDKTQELESEDLSVNPSSFAYYPVFKWTSYFNSTGPQCP